MVRGRFDAQILTRHVARCGGGAWFSWRGRGWFGRRCMGQWCRLRRFGTNGCWLGGRLGHHRRLTVARDAPCKLLLSLPLSHPRRFAFLWTLRRGGCPFQADLITVWDGHGGFRGNGWGTSHGGRRRGGVGILLQCLDLFPLAYELGFLVRFFLR